MLVFWILAAVMTTVAVAFVLVPLLRARPRQGPDAAQVNLEVLRGQRREIEADVANGTLPAEARDEALAELVERAQDDLRPGAAAPAAATGRKPWFLAGGVAIAVPALAFGLYLLVGMPGAIGFQAASHEGGMDEKQIVAMVDMLATKVKDRPDDVQGWALLARSMSALGRYEDAVKAYEHLLKIAPPDAATLADYADALGMFQGRSLAGRPYELVKQALQLDPTYPKALALAGTAALDANDFKAALGYWQSLALQLPPGSEDATRTQAVIAEVRERAKAAGVALADAPKAVAAAPKALGNGGSVTGSVSLAATIASKAQPSDTVFIFARAAQGPRVPLAVVRRTVGDLPTKFALDDTQAMSPTLKLSSADAVQIEARISRSGSATPQPGDLVGTSAVIKPGTQGVDIVVDRVVQ